jgi:hypothetical protein
MLVLICGGGEGEGEGEGEGDSGSDSDASLGLSLCCWVRYNGTYRGRHVTARAKLDCVWMTPPRWLVPLVALPPLPLCI